MKKIFVFLFICILISGLALTSVHAFDLKQEKPVIDGDVVFDLKACDGAGYVGDTIFNWEAGESFCVKMDTYVYFPFTAPSDGVYTVVIDFIGREGSNRAFDIEIDDTGRQFIDITESNNHQWAVIEFDTTKGDHEFRLWSPTDMDDSTLKSVDVYFVSLYLTEEFKEIEVVEEPVAEAAPVAVETPKPTATAPQTSDSNYIITALLIVSLYFAFKIHKTQKIKK